MSYEANVAMTIRDLREMADHDKPNTVLENAIRYLDLFLEKLCTREYTLEERPWGQLRCRSIIPAFEAEFFNGKPEKEYSIRMEMDLKYKIEELLANYEQSYGLEPVTIEEALPYLKTPAYLQIEPTKEQLLFYGYKIYKKKVR